MISFLYSKINAQKIEDTLVDIDGNKYKTIVVGNQVWMVENLKTTRFNDGIKISNITDPITWVRTTEPAYSWYNNDILNKSTYGGLYNWHSVNTGKLCPEGWRVSTDSDWIFLLEFLENSTSKYKKLKNIGFYSILGGYRYGYYWGTGIFYEKDINGYWWTSTTATDTHNWSRTISSKNLKIYRSYFSSNNGFSVKCIKENFKKYSEYENQQYVTDIDGNIYYTIEIGPQKWMTENLKTTRYNDGTPIKNLT
ncbi:MAG: FISUMP domain-containing protein, partial [Atribacterota bacterium]|nr:FISUMP domain-containing protein [Atribacterota bacterium]